MPVFVKGVMSLRTLSQLRQPPAGGFRWSMEYMDVMYEAWYMPLRFYHGAQGCDAEVIGAAEQDAQRFRCPE